MLKKEYSYTKSHSDPGYGVKYEETYSNGYYFYLWKYVEKPIVEKIFTKLKEFKITSCLDIACGTGRILSVEEEYFSETFGIDISEPMLFYAKKKCIQSSLVRADITKVPFKNKFDLITAFRFYLNADYGLRKMTLNSIHQLLNKNGLFILNIHVNASSARGKYYMLRNKMQSKKTANVVKYEDMVSDLKKNGFSVIDTYWYGYLPRFGRYFSFFPKYFMLFIENTCRNTALVPDYMAENFLMVCRKTDEL
jgi:SAM-dependent methyltransferase